MARLRSLRWLLFFAAIFILSVRLWRKIFDTKQPSFALQSSKDSNLVEPTEFPQAEPQWTEGVSGYYRTNSNDSRYLHLRPIAVWIGMLLRTIWSALSLAAVKDTSNQSVVDLSYGRYSGVNLPTGITEFLGVRYANSPVRFSASGPPVRFSGIRNATRHGAGCQGSGGTLSFENSEDCLFADIYAPSASIRISGSVLQRGSIPVKLPVYVFIQGGGLTNTLGRFNGAGLIQAGNLSFITVSFTYRAGAFGFLASKEVQAGGDLNNGLLDQVQLLRWVQKEIHVFGGDPNRVILGGQSAGAGCILSHLTASNGVDPHLYHAALIQSPSSPPIRNITEQQFQYDQLVRNTNCAGSDTLACLRTRTTDQILSGSSITPYPGTTANPVFGWHIVIDGKYVVDRPRNAFTFGRYVHVPMMIGAVTDEGTIFTPGDISNAAQSMAFLQNNFPNLTYAQMTRYSGMYGFGYNTPNYWLKASTAYGETRYVCPAVHFSQSIPSWSFRYNISTSSQIASFQGAGHSSDLAAVWAPNYGSSDQVALLKGAAKETLTWLQGYWSSFIQTYDPNIKRFPGSPEWIPYAYGERRFLFNVTNSGMEVVAQDLKNRCSYITTISDSLEQ